MSNFRRDLAESEKHDSVIDSLYFFLFSGLKRVERITDRARQLTGVDKDLHFQDGTTKTVEEKVRRKDYGDFLIEEFSSYYGKDDPRNTPGWVDKDGSDYLFYFFIERGGGFLLPFKLLQSAWRNTGKHWKTKEIRPKGSSYDSLNHAIQTSDLVIELGIGGHSENFSGAIWTDTEDDSTERVPRFYAEYRKRTNAHN